MRRVAPLCLLLALTCSEAPPAASPARADPPASASRAGAPPGAPAASREGPEVVRYDLVRHVARAELFDGEARVMDLGAPAGQQYTLGGWRTRTGAHRDLDGASAALVTHVTGFFLLPIDSPRRCHLSMRARGVADGRVTLYVDDQTVGHARLPTDGSFATVHVEIPEDRCTRGEHELRLRVASTGALPGLRRVGVAVDWIRLGAEGSEVGPPEHLTDAGALSIPRGWTLAYAFEVPEGARLRGRVEGDLEVRVERDAGAPVVLERFDGADLGRFAHEIVRLRLHARGDVRVRGAAVVAPGRARLRPARRVRNAIVYLTDTLRADHLRAYEPETRVATPGLDAWARRASTSLFAHAQENWTKPSCATLLSGLYPWEHHATTEDARVPEDVELLSETLRRAGFHTGALIANGFVSARFGFRQGWSTFRNYVHEGRRNRARFVADDVLAWLDERPDDRPFFLYVHTVDPHVPYLPPREDLLRYDPAPYAGVVDFGRDRQLLEGVKSGRIRLSARDRLRLEALYDGEITYHDRHFARVMEALERRGLTSDTLVVFTADHGEEFFDHGSVGHGHSVFEELIHVPLLVRWPGVTERPVPVEEAVGLVDVAPTVLEALGVEVPRGVRGRSLGPLLRGGTEDAPRPAVTGFMNGWRTLVVGRYKLVQRTPHHASLYDLRDDPGERHDLSESHPIALRYLRGLLGLTLAGVEREDAAGEHEAVRVTIDPQTRAELEALGYTGASRPPHEE